jgi:hypothetical protein
LGYLKPAAANAPRSPTPAAPVRPLRSAKRVFNGKNTLDGRKVYIFDTFLSAKRQSSVKPRVVRPPPAGAGDGVPLAPLAR